MAKLSDFQCAEYKQADQIKKFLQDAARQRRDIRGRMALSLCCMWIRNHRSLHRKGGGERERLDLAALRIQNLITEADSFSTAFGHHCDLAFKFGFFVGDPQVEEMAKKYELVLDAAKSGKPDNILKVCNSSHSYALLYMSAPTLPDVWVSTYKSSGKIFGIGSHLYAFDPNFGEYRIESGNIIQFITALRDEYQSAMPGLRISTAYVRKVGFK
jgi:hypothetical protein